ncbi:MAG: hypothetical protein DRN81_03875 [Thermoproteota archaeon]|nr:MAG: hypothetical protein DRN81_03875 [Candidatus Korarchaeota archaeon]
MTEKIAKGRMTWARLIVEYDDGSKIIEDRSDPYFWNNLSKDNIKSMIIEHVEQNIQYSLTKPENHNFRFFHYKKKKIAFGSENRTKEYYGIGMVINQWGDFVSIEVSSDGTVRSSFDNVIAEGRNLELHDIRLEEIY